MKKILFVLNDGVYPFHVGGMEIFNYYFINKLKERFDISYLATHSLKQSGIRWIRSYNIKPTKIFTPLQTLLFLLFNPSIKKTVISFSAASWVTWYIYSLVNTLLKRDYYVVIHHGKSVPKDAHSYYKRFFSKAKKVIAVSDDIKFNYDKEYGICCEVLYPLVPFCNSDKTRELIRKEYDIPTDAKVICMVGTIKAMKNPDTLLTAVSRLTESEIHKYNIYILYAGSGQMLQELKDEAERLGISERIRFLGFVPKESVNLIFEASDIYVIASDYEGTSVSLLEAMCNKKIILAADSPGINDMVKHGDTALLFKARDADELKMHILTVMENTEDIAKMQSRAFEVYNEKYNYDDMINSYVQYLNE